MTKKEMLMAEAIRMYVEEHKTQSQVQALFAGWISPRELQLTLRKYVQQRHENKVHVDLDEIKKATAKIKRNWTPAQASKRWIASRENSRHVLERAASKMLR